MSFPPDTQTLELELESGIHMRAYVRGDGPRTVLFLHGFPELAVSWHPQFHDVPEGFRFVAPDLRGYGGTTAPAAIREYRMDRLVADVLALAKAVGANTFDLVGHDWGGAIAWEVARAAPRSLRTLSILNCPPGDVMARALLRNPRQLAMSWYMFFFQLPKIPEWYFRRDPQAAIESGLFKVALRKEVFTAEILEPYVTQVRERGLPGLNYYRAALSALLHPSTPSLIDVPTRIVWGLGDGALGPWFAEHELYRTVATDLDIVRIAEAGHWVQQEAPEQVNRALHEHWAWTVVTA